jgi:Replication-relaxation
LATRRARVGSSVAWEVAKRTTERDREIAWILYRQKILTTDQLRLLFFSSLRRCQDRLLWLHRHRVIDRFYPAGPFSLGKPQAHWLLDEVGAYLVAARLGIERKRLAWDRQQDFHAHAQLAHRLECNAFLCGVIAATLSVDDAWASAWELGWEAIRVYWPKPGYEMVRPDATFTLSTPLGLVVIALEWDRATEPMATLISKIERYRLTLDDADTHRTTNVCFVVPGERRAERLLSEGREKAKHVPKARFWVTTTTQLASNGPLADVWRCLNHEDRLYGMGEFEFLDAAPMTPREQALGRRWQVPMPERWAELSPLRASGRSMGEPAVAANDDDELAREWERRRAQESAEAEQEAHDGNAHRHVHAEPLRSDGGSGPLDGMSDDGQREEP